MEQNQTKPVFLNTRKEAEEATGGVLNFASIGRWASFLPVFLPPSLVDKDVAMSEHSIVIIMVGSLLPLPYFLGLGLII
jgi:hypothetical protein